MLTTQRRWPSTSKRAAVPTATSSTEHTRASRTGPRDRVAVLELLDDAAAQRRHERTHRQSVEHVVEEPEHDEPLGFLGRDAAGGEVVQLLVVDRADGARVRALDIAGLDLEVGHRAG